MAEWLGLRIINLFVPNVVGSSPTTGQIYRKKCNFLTNINFMSKMKYQLIEALLVISVI